MKVQPIAIPAIPVDELEEATKDFGTETLIGEGSYGRVYYGVLKNGKSTAIKKLDTNNQPDQEFLALVWCLHNKLKFLVPLYFDLLSSKNDFNF